MGRTAEDRLFKRKLNELEQQDKKLRREVQKLRQQKKTKNRNDKKLRQALYREQELEDLVKMNLEEEELRKQEYSDNVRPKDQIIFSAQRASIFVFPEYEPPIRRPS